MGTKNNRIPAFCISQSHRARVCVCVCVCVYDWPGAKYFHLTHVGLIRKPQRQILYVNEAFVPNAHFLSQGFLVIWK